jgi:menaquinone reductase, multiheme cytochrome c subunit
MTSGAGGGGFVFPKWTNILRPALAVLLVLVPTYLVLLLAYGASPQTTDVGYQPRQPVPYSHALHAGQLGIDCRYCHNTVERAAFAAVPPTQTCMNCHSKIRATSPKLLPIRESYASGLPVPWVKVHDLPDFVYFDHSAHVRRGVGCVECHGRVDTMEVVTQVERLSMGWCLDCHRAPGRHLRPPELVTKMNWVAPEDPEVYGRRLMQQNNIHPSTQCWTCHR